MEAEELTNDILAIKNIIPVKGDVWATFEVIENEELGKWFVLAIYNSFQYTEIYFVSCG